MVLETDFLRTDVPAKTKVFLRSLLICGKERPQQVLLKSKMTIGVTRGNNTFFRDNKVSSWKKSHCYEFKSVLEILLINCL